MASSVATALTASTTKIYRNTHAFDSSFHGALVKPASLQCRAKSNSSASCDAAVVSIKKSIADLAPLEAVLFDLDGTLCDSDPIHHHSFREMLLEVGFNNGVPIDEEFFVKNISGKHNDDIAKTLFPNDMPRGLKFIEEKDEMFKRIASEKLQAIKGLYKVTKWVEDRGLKRAAVTNSPRENAEFMISLIGLEDFFHDLIIGCECEHPKPHPDPYLKAVEALDVSKDHVFIFEDSVPGIRSGIAADILVVGLTTRNPENVLKKANPTILMEDYEDPKLWAALEELDKKGGTKNTAA